MTWLFSCSIPEDQKPIFEYLEAKENPLVNWVLLEKKTFFSSFLLFSSCFLFFFFFFFGKTGIFLALFGLGIFLGKIFLRWQSIKVRLAESRLVYEEGSWFDISIWEKPFFLLKNEKFLINQRINPILRRLSQYLAIWFFFLFMILVF
jgi:hypothetical protein